MVASQWPHREQNPNIRSGFAWLAFPMGPETPRNVIDPALTSPDVITRLVFISSVNSD